MSHLLTQEVARQAVGFVLPALQPLIEGGTFKCGDLHIVIANPSVAAGSMTESQWYEGGILYEHSVGERSAWQFPFDKIARSKCHLSWRYVMPTQVLQALAPHLLNAGDTVYYGSAVRDGLVVACSGVQPFYDQMVSAWVLEACRALCIQGREALESTHRDGFIA